MSKPEETMKVIKAGACATLSAKSRVSYQIATDEDSGLHVRITKNTGGGFFSNEWIAMKDIQSVMEEHPEGIPFPCGRENINTDKYQKARSRMLNMALVTHQHSKLFHLVSHARTFLLPADLTAYPPYRRSCIPSGS